MDITLLNHMNSARECVESFSLKPVEFDNSGDIIAVLAYRGDVESPVWFVVVWSPLAGLWGIYSISDPRGATARFLADAGRLATLA